MTVTPEQILIRCKDGDDRRIDAIKVTEHLAVHESECWHNRGRYVITHIPSGRAIPESLIGYFLKMPRAIKAAEALGALDNEWWIDWSIADMSYFYSKRDLIMATVKKALRR